MKKIYLLLIFILAVSVSFAQTKSSYLTSKKLNNSMSNAVNDLNSEKSPIQIKAIESDADVAVASFNSIKEAIQARQNAPQAAPTVQYLRPDGSLFYGYTRDYKAYSTSLHLYTPAAVTLDFVPYSNTASATFHWTSGTNSLDDATDSDGVLHWVGAILPSGRIYNIPKVEATADGESSTYQLGQGVTYQYMFSGNVERADPTEDGTRLGDVEEFSPLTLANMHANRPTSGNLYGSFTDVGGFSPKYIHPEYGACTGIMQVLPKMASPLYAESVSVLAYTPGGTAMPAGGELKIQFYYLTEDGNLGDLIAESTTNEFVKTYDPQGVFVFTFEEEEDGFIIEKPLILGTQAPVAIILSGFDSTWDFNVLFGTNGGYPGSSYTLHGDHISTFGFSNAPDLPRADLYIEFNGIFNCLTFYDDPISVEFPEEGGWGISGYDGDEAYNDIDLYSAFDMEDVWIESMPDWITEYEFDNTYFESNYALMLFCSAEALPAGVLGRGGEIVVGSYGVTVSIPVTQGQYTSIPSRKIEITSVERHGDDFVLKYPALTNSVSVYNVAGQKIASYRLPDTGTFTIPAGNYSKGVYLISFSGAKGASTVKVMK